MREGTRTFLDRRSGTDRRTAKVGLFARGRFKRRRGDERRSRNERRKGWVRVDKWSSVQLERLKIAEFLKLQTSKTPSKIGS